MKRSIVRLFAGSGLLLAALSSAATAQEYMKPTKQHEEMAHEEGVWDAEVTMWMAPDAEPVKSKAVETNKMLGKMWLMSSFEGEIAGETFSGRSALGYDPLKKKYVGGWVDTMSPFMMSMTGDYDANTHTLTMMGEGTDCMTGKNMQTKMVTRYEGEDAKTFEMHKPVEGEAGKWWKVMEIKYTRQK
ncbi:MAG: DUF1579 domain-containing protein [Pirellulales bacterium]|nr:DUF1579 domain-containing protein [Pirellulales bacterium]